MAGEQLLYNRPLPGARLNMSHPLAKGLVGCWLLNENGGMRAMDLSPYNNHGTLTNFANPPPRPFNGLLFDGSDDYITIPNAQSLQVGASLTVTAGAKSGAQLTDYDTVICKNSVVSDWKLGRNVVADKSFLFVLYNDVGGASQVESPANSAIDGQCYLLRATFDGVKVELFLDEVSLGTAAFSGTRPALTSSVEIGVQNYLGTLMRYYAGSIYFCYLHNRVLTNPEGRALYLNPYAPYGERMFL